MWKQTEKGEKKKTNTSVYHLCKVGTGYRLTAVPRVVEITPGTGYNETEEKKK